MGLAGSSVLSLTVNGRRLPIDPSRSGQTLLELLREQGLTGAKEGCAEGECGACAVAVVAPAAQGSTYRVVNSCLMPALDAADREVLTVESLASGGVLAAPQRAIAEAGGSQCGYCTPGFVVSLFTEYYRPGRSGPCDPLAMAGNLCRCTGYRPIRDAALSLGAPEPGPFQDRLTRPALPLTRVSSNGYVRPTSLDELVATLGSAPDARVLAGATDLGVAANLHDRRWPCLVSIAAVPELQAFEQTPDAVAIGAGLSLTEVGERWTSAPPAVGEWLALFASPPVRNRATLGGNLATASPIGDAAPLLLALNASLRLAGPGGWRLVPLSSFFTAYRQTVLNAAEVIVSIEIPRPYPQHLRFYKVAKRRLDDISTVAAAISMDLDARRRISRLQLAFGGVAATPIRVHAAEAAVVGEPWNESTAERAADLVDGLLSPLSDHRGSSEYRRGVSASLVRKFWWETQA